MSQSDLLKKVVAILNSQNMAYMLTGSLVSSIQGEPRSTHDIDIIVAISPREIRSIFLAFPADEYYLDQKSMDQAVTNQGMFNVIDLKEGDKVDFWILTTSEFDQSRFARRQSIELFGEKVWISSAEDTILAKLRWSELCGGSQKHFLDALKVYEIQYPKLDTNYMRQWVRQLKLPALFKRLLAEARIVP